MTYRLPLPANQAPGTAYTTTSQPSDGPLAVGLLAPGQSQQRKKKKKKKKKNTVEGGSRTIRTAMFRLEVFSSSTLSLLLLLALLS